MFYYSTELQEKTDVCIFDTLGGKKVIYEVKNPSAPPVIDHQVRLCSERLKGQASICNFSIKCNSTTCGKLTSYSDQMVSHQLVRGLADPSIQEQILSHAADNLELNLNDTLKFIEAKDSGKRSSNILSSTS